MPTTEPDDAKVTPPPERPPASIARLVQLLLVRSAGFPPGLFDVATGEALAHAQALGPALATEAVTWILERYERGGDHRQAERAADAAARLPLPLAAPALVGCLERLSEYDPVAHAALEALEKLGAVAVEPLLAAFERSPPELRVLLGNPLSRTPAGDPRVRAALESLLSAAPAEAASLLSERPDRRSLPALEAAFDRLELPPEGPEELDRLLAIVGVGQSIASHGGELTGARRARFDRAYDRSGFLLGGE